MNSLLHIKKIEILTRLIKEKAIDMHEALVLLKDENLDQETYNFIIDNSSYWSSDLTNHKIKFDDSSTNF